MAVLVLGALAAVLLWGVVYKGVGKGTGQLGRTLACNSNVQKCACLFEENVCPTDAQLSMQYSEDCPNEADPAIAGGCVQNFDKLVDAARKGADVYKKTDPDAAKKFFGTCCLGSWKDHPSLRRK
ncbi:hypothetical protein HZB03_01480 [Candidatus Woesearchaeota archaeon]|nr:hypothetical protein [Candidatus Woesearchaeota archaeon]